MEALLIKEKRQDERVSSLEQRMARVEELLLATGIAPVAMSQNITPRTALMELVSKHTSDEDIKQAAFDLSVDEDNFEANGKMAMARELFRELDHQNRLYMLVGWLKRRIPSVDWPSI